MADVKRTRLDSWGEIAQYLRCDETTAWRWEKSRGLPVHRLPGGRRNAVFAYTDEIDAWRISAVSGHDDGKSVVPGDVLAAKNGTNGAAVATRVAPAAVDASGNSDQVIPVLHGQAAPLQHSFTDSESSSKPQTKLESPWLFIGVATLVLAVLLTVSNIGSNRTWNPASNSGLARPEIWPDPRLTQYDFEEGEQGWIVRPHMMIRNVFSSTAHAWQGKRSLAILFDAPYSHKSQIYVLNPPVAGGQTITAHVWCPANTQLKSVALFVEDRERTWSNDWHAFSALIPGAWNKLVLRIPSDAATPMFRLGLEFTADSMWYGTCYLDTVDW